MSSISTSTSTNSSTFAAPASHSSTSQTPSITNTNWDTTGVFPINELPSAPLERVIGFLGATDEGTFNLVLANRELLYRTVYGIDRKNISSDPNEADKLVPLKTKDLSSAQREARLTTYKNKLADLTRFELSFRLEIISSFIEKMARCIEVKQGDKPDEFHNIMDRDIIFARSKNRTWLQKQLDYAHYIYMSLLHGSYCRDPLYGNTNDNISDEKLITTLLKVNLSKPIITLTDDLKPKKEALGQYQQIRDAVQGIDEAETEKKSHFALEPRDFHMDLYSLYCVPPRLGRLSHLRTLGGGSYFQTLPPEFGQLENLNEVILHNRGLIRMPSEIGKLTDLKNLYLDCNSLQDLPAEIGNLKSLEILSLGINPMSQLPDSFSTLTSLTDLHLDDTSLSELPAWIGNLTKLVRLNLKGTPLTDLPRDLTRLGKLEHLNLRETNHLLEGTQLQEILNVLEQKEPPCQIE